ncbi:hypothetical protein CIW83_09295 [Tissierella sp. P1]|uniref:SEC-C metal-binding domain-containing protein n=1 Tax=Tissierella sp. P1 TaxID=1280483 RepID=UPI000BA16CA1|nr:SEC-C metal-binding domain-containing protein [Tissierella sp. P1]OZV12284.1 hypothetical protein CIW83_09295 [Tissierella sp. P1]
MNEDKYKEHRGSWPVQCTLKYDKRKIGRNESCPCGSGKKYKKCCGPVFRNNRCHLNSQTLY